MFAKCQKQANDTKERILTVAEAAVIEKGFAATSIEELIAAVGITKADQAQLQCPVVDLFKLRRGDVLLSTVRNGLSSVDASRP